MIEERASWFFSTLAQREISAKLGGEAVRRIRRKSYERKEVKGESRFVYRLEIANSFQNNFYKITQSGDSFGGVEGKKG